MSRRGRIGRGEGSRPAKGPPPPPLPLPGPPFALEATASLGANLERVVAIRLHRALTAAEKAVLGEALDQGLSVLESRSAEVRRQLLAETAAVALAQPGTAQLWACCVEACEGAVESVQAVAAAITAGCATVAGVLLAQALGEDA